MRPLLLLFLVIAPHAIAASPSAPSARHEACRAYEAGRSAPGTPSSGPVLSPVSGAEIVANAQKRYPIFETRLSPTPDPAFTASAADLFAASLQASKDGTAVQAAFKPFRLTGFRPLWGLDLGAAAAPGKPTVLSTAYRFEYRWLFPSLVAEQLQERAVAICDAELDKHPDLTGKGLTDAVANGLNRETNSMWFALLPVLTIEADFGFFAIDSTKKFDQRTPGSQSLTLKLDWRLETILEVTATGALSRERVSSDVAQDYASYRSASGSVVVIVPHLLGATYGDETYRITLFQRGMGFGGAVSFKKCMENLAGSTNCGAVRDRYAGGILDIRLSPSVRPRLTVGWHGYDLPTTSGTISASGVEIGVQIATALRE